MLKHQLNSIFRVSLLLALPIVLLFPISANAQFPRFKPTTVEYDTAFLNRSPSKWSIRLYSVSKYQQFKVNSRSTDASLKYAPNKFYGTGLGVSYNRLNLDVGFNAFKSRPHDDSEHESRAFDFIGSLYSGQHLFEIYLQQSIGMFGWLNTTGDIIFPVGDTTIAYREDISAFNFGVDYNLLFNSKKITFGSLIGTEIQKKSAGGVLAGLFFSSYDLHADSSIVPAEYASIFEDHSEFTDAFVFNIGLSGGYAYTIVFPLHIYLTLSLAPGFSLSRSELKSHDEWYVAGHPVNLSFKLISRGALGYGGKKVYGVLSLVSDRSFLNISNKNYFMQDIGKLKLVFGYRF
ncbi:MAG: DUF4421 family protein [Chitinophagales bacterium]